MTQGTTPGVQHEVRWNAALLECEAPEAVESFIRSIHGYAKRLSPEQRAKFLFGLDSTIYGMLGEAAISADGDLHPKHRLMKYHDFFCGHIQAGDRVIDLGSGVGALACSIAARCRATVVGLDWSEKNLALSRARADAAGMSALAVFEFGDITTHRVPGCFDVVVLSNVLEHIRERENHLSMWREWYSPSRFLIRVPAFDRDWRVPYKKELGVEWRLDDTHETEYTRAQLEHELSGAGLEIAECTAIWGEYWIVARPTATP